MKSLFGFGDSYTQGHHLIETFTPFMDWKEYIGKELPPVWIDILGNKLDVIVKNYATAGSSNQEIFHTFIKNCDEIKKDDIVIINWTYVDRFRWGALPRYKPPNTVNPFWKKISASTPNDRDIKEQTRLDIIENRITYGLCVKEVYDYQKIIDLLSKSIGFDVYYWSADPSIIYSLPKETLNQKKYIINDLIIFKNGNYDGAGGYFFNTISHYGGKTVQEETNYECTDNHLGESGHKVQADLFYNYLISIGQII
jgi:hypothetical protein